MFMGHPHVQMNAVGCLDDVGTTSPATTVPIFSSGHLHMLFSCLECPSLLVCFWAPSRLTWALLSPDTFPCLGPNSAALGDSWISPLTPRKIPIGVKYQGNSRFSWRTDSFFCSDNTSDGRLPLSSSHRLPGAYPPGVILVLRPQIMAFPLLLVPILNFI